MSFMQQKNTFVALAALATVIAGCATETGEEPQDQQDTQDTQAPAGQQDVKVEVDTSQHEAEDGLLVQPRPVEQRDRLSKRHVRPGADHVRQLQLVGQLVERWLLGERQLRE
jgi:hypothetical protein